ncbi:MAG: hypothetical protein Q7R34_15510 [Dehalococcoidia bacterium]|nr:hypothetical protein [Dehalococcoidia bacterium]
MSKNNPARTTSVVWWILTPVFLFLTFFSFSSDIGDAAYAMAFGSFIMFITAIIVAVIYGSRARKLDQILSGEGLIAHWTYTPDEWLHYAEKEYQTEKSVKRILFFIIAGFALVIGIVFLIVDPESGIWVLVVMLALIAIIGFVAWFTAWHDHRQNIKHLGEAYISKDGIYLNKQLHLWNQLAAYLGSVEYIEETPPLLVFSYFAPTRTGLEQRDVRVPVPHGQEARAREVLEKFQAYTGKR